MERLDVLSIFFQLWILSTQNQVANRDSGVLHTKMLKFTEVQHSCGYFKSSFHVKIPTKTESLNRLGSPIPKFNDTWTLLRWRTTSRLEWNRTILFKRVIGVGLMIGYVKKVPWEIGAWKVMGGWARRLKIGLETFSEIYVSISVSHYLGNVFSNVVHLLGISVL